MPNESVEMQEVATYAQTLFEVARAEGREAQEAHMLAEAIDLSSEVLDLISVMRERGELDLLPKVAKAYQDLIKHEDNALKVEVTTAVALPCDVRDNLIAKLEHELNQPVILTENVNPAISVTTSVSLNEQVRAQILAQLGDKGAQLPAVLIEDVDPSILGGIIVRIENDRRDASIATQLKNAHHALVHDDTNQTEVK